MTAIVSAQGTTSLVMVMNLSRFVRPEDREAFEALRGTEAFHQVIHDQWIPSLGRDRRFSLLLEEARGEESSRMSAAEVGFASGVFRQFLLENYTFPVYRVNKIAWKFPPSLESNYQFRHIFLPVWKQWDIYIRPSVMGVLVIRLRRKYEKATMLEQMTADVVRLQAPFDIPSALQWLEQLKGKLADDAITFQQKQESVQELLRWLGSDLDDEDGNIEYSPAQWQMAMEISRAFVNAVGPELEGEGYKVRLYDPPQRLSHPLHDSYVIYRLDALYASPHVLPSYRSKTEQVERTSTDRRSENMSRKRLVRVRMDDLLESLTVRQRLLNMLEGALLRSASRHLNPLQKDTGSRRFFPYLRRDLLDTLQERNLASWYDELCVMNSRATLIIPSATACKCDLFISTLPVSVTTSQVKYLWYWEAIERMIEFVAEIRVLAQLVEHASSRLLQYCVKVLHRKRRGIMGQNTASMFREFNHVIAQTANLSRLLAITQTLNNPATWSRAEFALSKATHLLQECSVPLALQHAAENISNLNALVEHLDELFLADTSLHRDRINFLASLIFTGFSLVLTVLMLPSFWADIHQLDESLFPGSILAGYLAQINEAGSWLAVILVVLSAGLFSFSSVLLLRNLRGVRKKLKTGTNDATRH